ncbi:DUF1097 domain-containing protein [Terrabacter sp. C0L_2]|jgi:hypothetical protein|uniref:DUF1097 domain-containing protein n=1 Tax=Terrabacter sp. C0L_2 TaxID=3108389 RepID=UPI002ED039F5|nr:DUF1097 domain-containing protein [Terrabacter sp. C0L_2]
MKSYVGVGVSVGVLAGLWTQVSVQLGLVTWVAFIAWACYFAAGGGFTGFRKGLAANLSGVVWGWLASLVAARLTFDGALAMIVTVLAFVLCVQAAASVLSFIPGAFAGTAVFFGTSFAFWPTVLALVVGAGLGWASGVLGERIQKTVDRRSSAGTAGTAEPIDPVTPAAA